MVVKKTDQAVRARLEPLASLRVLLLALSASLAYYDSLRRPYLENASLIQAQRDCFGGHTYRRRDDPDGTHTTQWLA